MILFYRTSREALKTLTESGIRPGEDELVTLWVDPGDDRDRLAVAVDLDRLSSVPEVANGRAQVGAVPRSAIANLDPYRPPIDIGAAGGYVIRRTSAESEPEVLMIFRRGVWDLPKGKIDPGEDRVSAALREVREEVGVHRVEMVAPLGTTIHAFERGGRILLKTTYWFQMRCEDTAFTPQVEEDIESVEWVPWNEARVRVGYPSLEEHMTRIEREGLLRF